MKLKVPESVLKQMTSCLDGRRNDEVTLVVDRDGLAIELNRGGTVEWTREAYERSRNKVRRLEL